MAQERPYHLSFYESGYIKPEEFERRNWLEDAELIRSLHTELLSDPQVTKAVELIICELTKDE